MKKIWTKGEISEDEFIRADINLQGFLFDRHGSGRIFFNPFIAELSIFQPLRGWAAEDHEARGPECR